VECPECLLAIPQAPGDRIPDHAETAATGRGVASAGDIDAPVFTGDIHGNVTVELGGKLPPIPPPPPPERPPDTSTFVGRESELSAFTSRLEQSHLVVITGMAGVGKTALAAALAQQHGVPAFTFWHTFHPDESIETLIWQMAGYLGFHGRRDLWDLLYRARQGGSQPPPPEVLFNYLLQMLRADSGTQGGYLLCLDDFHFVYDEPLFDRLIGALLRAIRAGELRLILTSRRVPGFASSGDFEPLTGLSFADTKALLAARQVHLADKLVHDVYLTTGGNAQLLILAANALQRSRSPAALVNRLIDAGDIEDYLIREVDEALSAEERRVMSAMAVLLGYPATREAV
jgi:ATP/maltotriose-dependent transcriptional regulator MalT